MTLAPLPSRILAILVAESGTLVPRSELRRRVWGETWLDWESALHQAVRRIRVALDDSAATPRYVETLPRRGYRFVGRITEVPVASSPERRSFATLTRISLAAGGALALAALLSFVDGHAEVDGVSPEALRLHREGIHLLGRAAVPEAMERFERAAEAAPEWAAPWSAVAEAELAHPGEGRVDRARLAIEHALGRDPDDAHAWRVLASLRLWEEWDWIGARGALDRAARLAPDSAEVWQLVAALETVLGREAEALVAARRAVALDPISTGLKVDLGWTLYYFGDVEEALVECRRGLELEPQNPMARQCALQALLQLGRREDAAALFAGTSLASESEPVDAYFELQLAMLHETESCASAAAAAIPRLALGQREQAWEALAAAAQERRGWELPFARVDPLLASLRSEPGFAELTRALGVSRARSRRSGASQKRTPP